MQGWYLGRRIQGWLKLWLIGLVSLCLVVACQPSPPPSQDVTADCVTVSHSAGETCIPKTFERLVTLDSVSFEYAIAADLQPVGTTLSNFQTALPALQTDVANIGQSGEPSLEEILKLDPDLLVGLDFHGAIYPQLSQIAPTFLLNFEHSGLWKPIFQNFGEALGKTDVVAEKLAAYNQRVQELQNRLGDRRQDLQISVIRLYPDSITMYLQDSFCGTILQDVGLSRPPAQAVDAETAQAQFGNPIQAVLSEELLSEVDGDVIFVWTGENTATANAEAQEKLADLQKNPLWNQLQAVQKGQVYQVPSYWIGSGPVAAEAILDDLFTHLTDFFTETTTETTKL
ncbi:MULTISPECIES: ABC transporter substrate-binding protein [Cyanophyceae]|nr:MULTISPECIES: iron-siderophore ABC transporter substrate-binding protein [Cyanophyceae]ACB01142.1 Periplasmic binding protein; probable iron siderophore transporter system [Picosynechococcus sp. PCC 7002]SMH48213.1 iron complex transport system substrate-binding protein [Picosynechococcus sp. OG1]SMQ81255.1 iron complex transport system substrate-binding protein [Synechococcus sp. 7002]